MKKKNENKCGRPGGSAVLQWGPRYPTDANRKRLRIPGERIRHSSCKIFGQILGRKVISIYYYPVHGRIDYKKIRE